MTTRLLCCVALAVVATAASAAPARRPPPAADPPPATVDVSAIKQELLLYHDGKGHHLALLPPTRSGLGDTTHVYYGDGKVLYRQTVPGARGDRQDLELTINDPRFSIHAHSRFVQRSGKTHFQCSDRETPLALLEGAARRHLLATAVFKDLYFRRWPYFLARDTRGTYYYVDTLDSSRPLSGAQVMVGPRGKLRRLPMKNIVADEAGEIFITPRGQLRLLTGRRSATWFVGSRGTALTIVNVGLRSTVQLIFRDLGAYGSQRLHRPCDDL